MGIMPMTQNADRNYPTQVYRPDTLLSVARFFLWGASVVLLAVSLGAAFAVLWLSIRTGIAGGYTDVLSILNRVVLVLILLIPAVVPILLWHLWLDIGVSGDLLWYRAGIGWHAIKWSEITHVEPAQFRSFRRGHIGVLVYTSQLPIFFRFYAAAYGRHQGRALLVPSRLVQYKELETLIASHVVQGQLV